MFFSRLDTDDSLMFLDHYPSTTSSSFHSDPFGMITKSSTTPSPSSNTFSSTAMHSTNDLFAQSQPQLIPTRVLTPLSAAVTAQTPLTLKNLSLHTNKKQNEAATDLLNFDDTKLSSKIDEFDPYA